MSTNEAKNKTLEFLSSWQLRAAKQQRIFVSVLIATLAVSFAIMVLGFTWYQDSNYERTIEHNTNYVQDNAVQEAADVEQRMEKNVRFIQKFAKQYAFLEENYPDATVADRINLLWDNTVFDRVSYVDASGTLTSLLGGADVSDRGYFRDAMAGNSGYLLLESSRVTGDPTLMYYAPIHHGDKVTGVLLGLHERERIDHQLSYKFLNYEPKTYLLQSDGLVIGSSNDRYLSENMFQVLEGRVFSGGTSYEDVLEALRDPERKTATCTFLDDGRSSIGVFAQFESNNMMIFTVLPSEITDNMIAEANNAGRRLILMFTAAFGALLAVFLFFLARQRKRTAAEMNIAADRLAETYAHDQRQSFIIESLSNTFSSVYFAEVGSLRYERIAEENDEVLSYVADQGGWGEGSPAFVANFVAEKDRERMVEFMDIRASAAKLSHGEACVVEYQRPDGDWRRAVMIPAERGEDGSVRSIIFAVQEIDAEKRRELDTKKALEDAYEAAKLASNAKTTFLSNISHDIRTPMNAIVGMTAIAGSNLSNSEKVADCLKKINIASRHLLGIINEVLDMSKIETGKVDLSEEAFHLPDLFDELITINQPLIREKGHTLSITVHALEHENVIGDSVRLQQVFTNLLTNAIKYTPAGGSIEIAVSEKPTNKPSIGWFEVVFRDNGIGMSEEFQRNMFEPFSRAKDSRITGIQGTGLGMPIARNIIRMMNGDIQVQSRINEGSTFTVSFSLRLQSSEEVDYSAFVDLPVLVVDDDPTACESTCLMLRSLTMQGEAVTNGPDAVARTAERHERGEDYYAVIIDWQMPGMNGIETARAIRARIGSEVPIIVISAFDWSEIEQEARAAGVNAFLSKPLFRSRLLNLFSELTGQDEREEGDGGIGLSERDFTGKRILLAEDNELNSEIAVEILSMMGLEVDTAANGRICLDRFAASAPGTYDLIFMDIQMPEMDGYQATSAIRVSGHPQAQTIPIVAMSANAFSTDVRNAISSGMNGHIAKPIDIDAVVKVLEEMLK